MTYVSCHDNHTLWDRLSISCPEASEAERIKMHKLALAAVLTSQGATFLHAGTEFLRTKQGVENSFESPDSINQMDWTRRAQYAETVDYVKRLIALRKAHPAFRMQTTAEVKKHLAFLDTGDSSNLIAYQISEGANGDDWSDIVVVLNGNEDYQSVNIPDGAWTIAVDGGQVNPEGLGTIEGGVLQIPGRTAMVLFR
jgi:pullulanase